MRIYPGQWETLLPESPAPTRMPHWLSDHRNGEPAGESACFMRMARPSRLASPQGEAAQAAVGYVLTWSLWCAYAAALVTYRLGVSFFGTGNHNITK